jgi:polar amino acid transport system substrate-binding protein
MKRLGALALVGALAGSALLAACGGDDDDTSSSPATTSAASGATTPGGAAADCATGKTLTDGKLVIATGDPAFPPYVIDDKPETGQGFESAVALAVAEEMGFTGAAVSWIRTGFDAAIAPGPKDFDFNLQQYSINPERQQIVSFSDPYYTANQAVLGYPTGAAANVTSISDLRKLKLGAAQSTTSLTFITDVIKPDSEPFVFNSNADAKTALDNQQIDAIVADLPTALYITGVEITDAKVFGQFPVDAGGQGDSWGLLFAKDNPLVECANQAIAALKSSGELDAITQQWMGEYTEAPTLSAS